jgi:hypothetical protein
VNSVSAQENVPGFDKGVKVFPPPEGTDPEEFYSRVHELAQTGMPNYNASKLAREEFLGLPARNHRAVEMRDTISPERAEALRKVRPELFK